MSYLCQKCCERPAAGWVENPNTGEDLLLCPVCERGDS